MKTSKIVACAIAVTAALGLASCSGGESTTTSDATAATTTVKAAEGAFPVSIETKFGEVTITEQPQRVVALGWGDAETALSLGIQPVGVSDWLGFGGNGVGPWVSEEFEQSPEILGTTELKYEAIAALQPDLILDVRSSGDQDRYNTLSAIAPVVGVPVDGDNWLTTREQQVTMIAAALGKQAEGTQQLADLDARIESIASAHPQWSQRSVSVLAKTSEAWGAYKSGDARMDLLLDLGFQENPWVAAEGEKNDSFYVTVSAENLSQTNSDIVFALPIGVSAQELEADAAWRALPAVTDGKYVVVDGELAQAFSIGTVEATNYALDILEPQLAELAG
ncbi:iron ABC transporter substrate-binding protein [Corynebacterium kutscheri]|uniref:iron-siderophore ABC transporter substrate-binding protein n=1 Tax=Corynebacterium kutscheri TaxID=35755 RepID=UPI000F6BAF3A|nr:iron-siderophore ABC transporter substrate-binding protein [Corynebacterium kutscheri]VEH80229.1 iron ABC transporter substrate-binding protein [Corynebacterium kutscheri]